MVSGLVFLICGYPWQSICDICHVLYNVSVITDLIIIIITTICNWRRNTGMPLQGRLTVNSQTHSQVVDKTHTLMQEITNQVKTEESMSDVAVRIHSFILNIYIAPIQENYS